MYSPKFTITNKILRNIANIEVAKEVIEGSPLIPAFEKKFKSDAMFRMIYHGTHIEGNDLSVDQTRRVLEGEEIVARARDIQEVINYRNVSLLLEDLANKRGGYDLEMLLDIHKETVDKLVTPEKIGVVRKTEVVVKEGGTGRIIFRPPPFVEIPYLLDDFFQWLNSDEAKEIHPVLKAGIAHYILVTIHPFVEGNGRTARAFANLILMREGYDIKRFFALEEHFDADPASYYKALSYTDKMSPDISQRDLTSWLEYFTEVVAIELGKIKEKVKKVSMDTRLRLKMGEQVVLTERQMKIVEYLASVDSASMPELKRIIPMVSEDTILRDIQDLMKKGVVKRQGTTKGARYIINR